MAVQIDTREVTVERTNGTGFRADNTWWNISKFAKADDAVMPRVGDRVIIYLDKSDYVRKIEPAPPPATPTLAHATPETPPAPLTAPAIIQDASPTVTVRLAVLAAAVAISTSGGATTEEEVVILAERLERWATR